MNDNIRILTILCLIATIGRLALDSYLPSLPAIEEAFTTSSHHAQLTFTLYLVGFGMSQFLYGPLSDRFGRKKIIVTGFIIFIAGNLISLFATSIHTLIAARLIAGLGGGASAVLSRVIAHDTFSGIKFAKAWSYTTMALMSTLMVAPLIGGYLQQHYGWRANLLFMTLYGMVIFVALLTLLPETNKNLNKHPFKIQSLLKNYYFILSHPPFLSCTLFYTLAFAGLTAYFQISPYLFIKTMGLSPVQYGCLSLYIAFAYFIGGLFVNLYVPKFGITRMLLVGMLLVSAGGLLLLGSYFLHYLTIPAVLLPTLIYVLGARIIIPNALAGSFQETTEYNAGSASAITGGVQMLGASLSSLVISTFNYTNQLALAICFILIGIALFIIFSAYTQTE